MSVDTRVLVTGAGGFVGSHLVEYLLSQGYTQVYGTAVSESPWLVQTLGEHTRVLDLTNEDAVTALMQELRPEWIVHLAGIATVGGSFENAWPLLETNLKLQYVMLEAVRHFSPQARLLSISSAAVYGDAVLSAGERVSESTATLPNNPYAVSKFTQESLGQTYFRSYGLDVVTVRPFNQIGPRQTDAFAVPAFAQQIVQVERGEKVSIQVGNLGAIRDFTDVRDAAVAYERLLQDGQSGEVYNLGSGKGKTMEEVLQALIRLSTAPVQVETDPSRLRPVDVPRFVADNQKLRSLGWEPKISLEHTLRDIMEYERSKEHS